MITSHQPDQHRPISMYCTFRVLGDPHSLYLTQSKHESHTVTELEHSIVHAPTHPSQ